MYTITAQKKRMPCGVPLYSRTARRAAAPSQPRGRCGGGGDTRTAAQVLDVDQQESRVLVQAGDAGLASLVEPERLAQRAGDEVDAAHDVTMLGRAAAAFSHEAHGMAVIHHHHGVMLFG